MKSKNKIIINSQNINKINSISYDEQSPKYKFPISKYIHTDLTQHIIGYYTGNSDSHCYLANHLPLKYLQVAAAAFYGLQVRHILEFPNSAKKFSSFF